MASLDGAPLDKAARAHEKLRTLSELLAPFSSPETDQNISALTIEVRFGLFCGGWGLGRGQEFFTCWWCDCQDRSGVVRASGGILRPGGVKETHGETTGGVARSTGRSPARRDGTGVGTFGRRTRLKALLQWWFGTQQHQHARTQSAVKPKRQTLYKP